MLSMVTSPAVPPTTIGRRRAPIAHTPLRRGLSPNKAGSNSSISSKRRREHVDADHEGHHEEDQQHEEEVDDEVARFMGEQTPAGNKRLEMTRKGSRQSDSVSEEEDLDCVQGLLKLSQGNWR